MKPLEPDEDINAFDTWKHSTASASETVPSIGEDPLIYPRLGSTTFSSRILLLEAVGERRAKLVEEEKPCGLEPRGREPTPEAGCGCLKESKGEGKEVEET